MVWVFAQKKIFQKPRKNSVNDPRTPIPPQLPLDMGLIHYL